jgi:hypothetical protein
MGISRLGLVLCLAAGAPLVLAQATQPAGQRAAIQPEAWRLVTLANAARGEQGIEPLQWDASLAEAARQHCLRMAAEGPISHRYRDEASVGSRTAQAGAHFSLIEENVAIGPTPAAIHEGWMNSPEHKKNLLNPEVDRVGVAVVASRGVLYAVADYSRAVEVLTQSQVEARIAGLVHAYGINMRPDATMARAACAMDHGWPPADSGPEPLFVMRWQDSDLSHLPASLEQKLKSRAYRTASVGNCPAQEVEGSFTLYRLAVLLFGDSSANGIKPQY